MTFPLSLHEVFGYEAGLVLGTLIGFAFGFVLERAGFGRAPVLAAQFYFVDNRVLKVMFSAIATALLGTTLLAGLGLLDMSLMTVPETFIGPQIVGGLLLGVGFVVSGYCPGTAVVGAGSGKIDALFAFVGVGLGSLVFGWMYPLVSGFYKSGAMGSVRFPDLLGVPAAPLALCVAGMAVGAFFGAEHLERVMARKLGAETPPGSAAVRNRVFVGFGAAAALSLATLIIPAPAARAPSAPRSIAPLALAEALVERPASLLVLDVRPAAACAARRIPGATCLPADDPKAGFLAGLPGKRSLVLYGASDLAAVPEGVRSYPGEVLALEGGYAGFIREVLSPPPPPALPTPEAAARFRLRAALHAHFTGARVAAPPPAAVPAKPTGTRPAKHGGGC